MHEPIVDIGVPVHRRPQFVASAVRSVIDQTYPHWRLTVSEDGAPTEAVRGAVEPLLSDERVTLTATGEHLGQPRHKSLLARRGDGRYLALLDDDDVWDPDWLERRVRFLESHPECGFVWGGHRDIDPEGRELARSTFPVSAGVHGSAAFLERMIDANRVVNPSVLIRRDTYRRAGDTLDARLPRLNDWELWLRLGATAPVGFLAVHDCGYRIHPLQMSRHPKHAADKLLLVDHLDALLAATHPELRRTASARRRARAAARLSIALDLAEEGKRRRALRQIAIATLTAPTGLASSRGIGAAVAALAPRPIIRQVARRRGYRRGASAARSSSRRP